MGVLAVSALVAFKYSTRAGEMQQMLGGENSRLLFMEEGAGERNWEENRSREVTVSETRQGGSQQYHTGVLSFLGRERGRITTKNIGIMYIVRPVSWMQRLAVSINWESYLWALFAKFMSKESSAGSYEGIIPCAVVDYSHKAECEHRGEVPKTVCWNE